jgi:hypothetical protein
MTLYSYAFSLETISFRDVTVTTFERAILKCSSKASKSFLRFARIISFIKIILILKNSKD